MLRILWQKKPFKILNAYVYALVPYSFSFDPSLWWPLLLSTAALKGLTHRVRLLASRNNAPQHIAIFPDAIIAA